MIDTTDTVTLVKQSLAKRYAAERRFRRIGLAAILVGIAFVLVLFTSIVSKGYTAFLQTQISLEINFDAEVIDPQGNRDPETIAQADFAKLYKDALKARFEVTGRSERRELYNLVSNGTPYTLRDLVVANPDLIGTTGRVWIIADDEIDMLVKGYIDRDLPESDRRISDRTIGWVEQLEASEDIRTTFNWTFLTAGDSREPEQAGIGGAVMGSFYTLMVTLVLSFPIGVAAAIYLEEFAPRNQFTDLIEVNINNLAAVPSIVFGLLGLAVFLNFFGMPRSAPVVGGLVLTLMTLPTIIIASRAALKSVPPSIRDAALGIGASRVQSVFHHVLPQAMPGMMTGTIIGMAQALGESAPLLMIGMIAFIVEIPSGPFDPATVLPVQIYLWADSPERAFLERSSAAIMVLLTFLIAMNALAVVLRKRFEKRW
ncbi:MAG: phosphate ABC transporter permease PstA [Sedimenticolaceae bacterium]|jgi:phosphate transport system permease protein